MAVIKHSIEASVQSAMTTALNTLTGLNYSAPSSAIDNNTAGTGTIPWLYADFYLTLPQPAANPTAGGYVGLYLLPALDVTPTNYASALLTTAGTVSPGEGFLVGAFPLVAAAGTQRSVINNVPLPAASFKLMLYNNITPGTANAFAGSGNTLEYRRHNYDVS